ncbi:peptide/nickel transport system substrate-binding protein [Rhizobium pisi]|uniref:ABC transporter substrate-binding protein n=1 Tax=Rhizobium pisi TaxID=574561 RepID=A0A427N105_9HYPH|nr:ABC transporter substrate-binding protein [Rhizobium pisi]MBB3134519.1 peptide/nickel transport system substrate-binding protein [Rhizobium pisi]RSB79517.1 ABC transporter substrate-binding protein [Rhizobium pisi]TCA59311.1 ABC transporter substrate-binding protein [Rhizobium pisi]
MKILVAFLLGTALAALPSTLLAQEKGGVINVATIGEPPTLDPMSSTADLVGIVTQHIFETLYTFDKSWNVTPLLAESLPEISADGKTYTIKLRTGIKFHDNSDMTSEDVVASLGRWTKIASRGKQVAGFIDKIAAPDPATVTITLKQPYAPLTSLLAFNNSAAIIIPSEKQDEPMKEFIGTGPYMLKERKADQYIQLVRFDGYKSREGDSNGYGGARHQYLDEIRFVPVPDPNTRVEAAVSGQYDYVDSIPVESYDKLKASTASQPVMLKPFGYPVFVFNTKEGAASNVEVRKAIRQALSMEDMLAAAFGGTDFYALDGAIYPKTFAWSTDAGVEGAYNVADPEGAATAAKKAGYNGEPIRILTSRQYEFHYKMAQVAAEYLKLAGFTVDMQVVDWATLTQRRTDPKLWDIYITHSPFLPEPALIGSLSTSSPGWWDTPARKAAVDAFTSEVDPKKRVALWADVQKAIYADAPFMKIGDFNAVSAKSVKLDGVDPAPWPYFWNASIKK